MTSAWEEPSDLDNRAVGQSCGPDVRFGEPQAAAGERDENQLEMFALPPVDAAGPGQPPASGAAHGGGPGGGGARHGTAMTVAGPPKSALAGAGGGDVYGDIDELRRLEFSIRQMMHESGIRHFSPPATLPRAATLPPVRGLTPVRSRPLFGGIAVEEADHGAAWRALDPDQLFMTRPSRRGGGMMRGVLQFMLASAVAAPIAYFIAYSLQSRSAAPLSEISNAGLSLEARLAAFLPAPRGQPPAREQIPDQMRGTLQADPVEAQPESSAPVSPAEVKPDETADAKVDDVPSPEPLPRAPAAPEPDPTPAKAVAVSSPPPSDPAPSPARPVLTAQEIAALVERGRTLFEAGDLAAARLFFRRAASAGDAAAALAMGATYDPAVLSNRILRGIGADPEEARVWYEKARELGSPEGPRRLEMLLAHR